MIVFADFWIVEIQNAVWYNDSTILRRCRKVGIIES